MNRYYYLIWILLFSIILLVAALNILKIAYTDIAFSLSTIRQGREIESNPKLLKQDISLLESHQKSLQEQMDRLIQMEQPNLESFSKIGNKFNLRLTGLNLKGRPAQEAIENKNYSLTYSGNLANTLDALNYIENNFLVKIDAMSLAPDENNNNIINLTMQVSLPQ